MTSFITLCHVDTIAYPIVELIKKELAGAIAIRRAVRKGHPSVEALYDQTITIDPGASSRGVAGGVDVGGKHVDATPSHDVEHVDAREKINMFENKPLTGLSPYYTSPSHPYTSASYPSPPPSFRCKYKECKDNHDKLFEKVEAITKVVEELKSKRGVIPSKKVRESYTPTTMVRRKKRAISQVLFNQKSKKITTPPSPKIFEVQGPFKKVDIYAKLGAKEKRDLRWAKQGAKYYPIYTFSIEHFRSMTDIRT
ncbi:hypothetical protein FXO37_02030 [Capsicum annuum]|nr:hypothetical protein FXO37_02030 [Capsicum annuum]